MVYSKEVKQNTLNLITQMTQYNNTCSIRAIHTITGIPERTLARWRKEIKPTEKPSNGNGTIDVHLKETWQVRRLDMYVDLDRLHNALVTRLDRDIPSAEAKDINQLFQSLGISIDKMASLAGAPVGRYGVDVNVGGNVKVDHEHIHKVYVPAKDSKQFEHSEGLREVKAVIKDAKSEE